MNIVLPAGIAVLLGGAVGFFSMGNLSVALICYLGLLGLAPLLLVLFGWAVLSRIRTGETHRVAREGLGNGVLVTIVLLTAITSGFAFEKYFIAQTRDFAAKTRPMFSAYYEQHGKYPESLAELPGHPSIPRLLRGEGCYRKGEAAYGFQFARPSAMMEICEYDSAADRWHSYD